MSPKRKPPINSSRSQVPFAELQARWYRLLKSEGFDDQEDTSRSDRPLKSWSGVSGHYIDQYQAPGASLSSSFPHSLRREEEGLMKHADYADLCARVARDFRSDSRLTGAKVSLIWQDYCAGLTIRESEAKHGGTSDTTISRVIKRIIQWMNLMSSPDEPPDSEGAIVVLRGYRPDQDNGALYASWRNALWYGQKKEKQNASRSAEFFSLATQAIKKLLADPKTEVRIACLMDDPNLIAGYSVLTGQHLEFVCVKSDYRRRGIARLLTRAVLTVAPPSTEMGREIIEKLGLSTQENHGNSH